MCSIRGQILYKCLEFAACLSTLIIKKLCDSLARRVSKKNQKLSNEWRLLNNITWSQEGDDFSTIIFGGYTLITAVLLLSRIIRHRKTQETCEKLLLAIGIILFFLIGCMVYISIGQVPEELHVIALVLGSLSFLVTILFIIDLCCFGENVQQYQKAIQADIPSMTSPIMRFSSTQTEATYVATNNETNINTRSVKVKPIGNNFEQSHCNRSAKGLKYINTAV